MVSGADLGSIVVAEDRRQIGFLFGFLILVFAVALVRGVAGAQTTAGRAAAGVFCAVVLVVLMAGLISLLRRPARLEVSADEIRFVRRDGRCPPCPASPDMSFVSSNSAAGHSAGSGRSGLAWSAPTPS
jgi:hypothetical protein